MRPYLILSVITLALLAACGRNAETRLAHIDANISNGFYRAAVVEARDLIGEQSGDAALRARYGRALLGDNDIEGAISELRKAREAGAPAESVVPWLADALVRGGRSAEALKELDSPEIAGQDGPDLQASRGLALLAAARFTEARHAFEQALAKDPKNARARLGLASVRARSEGPVAGMQELDRAAADCPQDSEVAFTRGTELARAEQLQKARDELARARTLARERSQRARQILALAALGDVQLAMQDDKAARATLADLEHLAPDVEPTLMLQARIAMLDGKVADAQAAVQRVLTINPDSPPAKLLQGAVSTAQGNLGQAETFLSSLIESYPKNVIARQLLAEVQLEQNKLEEAMDSASAQGIDSGTGLAIAGRVRLLSGNVSDAIAYFEKNRRAEPADVRRTLDLAMAYLAGNRAQDALKLLEGVEVRDTLRYRRESLYFSALLQAGRRDDLRRAAEGFAQQNETDARALMVAAGGLSLLQDADGTRRLLQRAAQANAESPAPLVQLGRFELARDDRAAATRAFEAALQRDSKSVGALIGLGLVAIAAGEGATAATQFEAARNASAEALEPRLMLALLYLSTGEPSRAMGPISEARRITPANPDVAFLGAWLDVDQGRAVTAVPVLEKLAQRSPNDARLLGLLARAYAMSGETDKAAAASARALKSDSHQWQAAYVAFRVAAGQRDVERATGALASLRTANAPAPVIGVATGDLTAIKGDYAGALRIYEPLYKDAPTRDLAVRIFQARRKLGQPDRRAPLDLWLKSNPNDLTVRHILAEDLEFAGEKERAVLEYNEIVQRSANDAIALNNLAWLKLKLDDPAGAVDLARRAFLAQRSDPRMADTYGWALVQAGRPKDALPVLRNAVDGLGGHPEARYHLAVALARNGDETQAREQLATALANPKFAQAEEARKFLESLGTTSR